MGGHGHNDNTLRVNPNAIQESDDQMPLKIREIELIKHNPNMFHVSLFDLGQAYQILGGASWLASATAGGLFGYWYYSQKLRSQPATFYTKILLSFSRIALGVFVGGWIGYMKFGDRQKLHNAWVAERLRRRYPESMDLTTTDLWRFKGVKAAQHYYRWT